VFAHIMTIWHHVTIRSELSTRYWAPKFTPGSWCRYKQYHRLNHSRTMMGSPVNDVDLVPLCIEKFSKRSTILKEDFRQYVIFWKARYVNNFSNFWKKMDLTRRTFGTWFLFSECIQNQLFASIFSWLIFVSFLVDRVFIISLPRSKNTLIKEI
jgi:hypothetical protein